MIFLDMRDGSDKLLEPLRKAGLPVEPASPQLRGGDLFFVGRGNAGAELSIGIEHKTVDDCVNSMRTQRLQGHQLPAMRAAEEGQKPLYDIAYLMIQGELITDASGHLARYTGRRTLRSLGMSMSEFRKRVINLHLNGGLNPIFTKNQHDSVEWIRDLYRAWTDKALDEHTSHLAIYQPPTLVPLSQFEQTIASLPDVGIKVARASKRAFTHPRTGQPSIRRAINASAKEWAAVETEKDGKLRKFGLAKAERLVEVLE